MLERARHFRAGHVVIPGAKTLHCLAILRLAEGYYLRHLLVSAQHQVEAQQVEEVQQTQEPRLQLPQRQLQALRQPQLQPHWEKPQEQLGATLAHHYEQKQGAPAWGWVDMLKRLMPHGLAQQHLANALFSAAAESEHLLYALWNCQQLAKALIPATPERKHFLYALSNRLEIQCNCRLIQQLLRTCRLQPQQKPCGVVCM